MRKLFFRVLLIGFGAFILYIFGGNLFKTFAYRLTGEAVEGRIVGFSAGRNGKTIVEDGSGVRNGKRKARRPFFRYPIREGSTDSLTERSDVSATIIANYEIGEAVTVVFSKSNPQDSYLFGIQMIMMNLLVSFVGVFALYMGVSGRIS